MDARRVPLQRLAEVHLATPVSAPFNFRDADSLKTPWSVLAGLRAGLHGPWALELSLGRGVTLDSGYGREGGIEGLHCYTAVKNVSHRLRPPSV